MSLPSGTVTFLFTDIEGSTRLWEQHAEAMRLALPRHDALAAALIEQHGGLLLKRRGEGDSLFAVFPRATDALAAACAFQHALTSEPWPTPTPLRVRMALHTGEADLREGDYYGAAVNRCARLRAVAHGGQVLLSLATEELVREALPEGARLRDLGLVRLQDLAQPEHVFQLAHPELPTEFPPLRSLEALPNNLPRQLTSFIGREKEMAAVQGLLSGTSLLTLTGSGGCGKTRLALQVAAQVLPEYPDGVWLVELASLSDPALVPQTVATALGVREEPGRPLEASLTEYLRARSLLLVLDNCEHLLAACAPLVERLLRDCPKLRVLASSREGLGISGEQTYRVPSLSLPDAKHLPPLERLKELEAVQLFADRARLSEPTFAVIEANATAVAQVCNRLDGIPLAIELAAARVKALSVEQIADRLDDRFRLLTGGSRTALPRQQTLRALIDWSYNLLSPSEKALLGRLAVFAGGWTLEAAEGVCVGEGVEEWEVLDLLTSLVEKSLVLYEGAPPAGWSGGDARYRLLETVRQYAWDRLLESGEGEAARGRHRDWYLALAEEGEPELIGEHQVTWLDRWEREHDNLRVALEWALETDPVSALRMAVAVERFWGPRGYWMEGRDVLARALERGADAPAEVRLKGLLAAGVMAGDLGDREQAKEFSQRSLELSRQLGHARGMAQALMRLGRPAESLAIAREAGDRWAAAWALNYLGWSEWVPEDWEAARGYFEESLALAREVGDKSLVGSVLCPLGHLELREGDRRSAHARYQESLSIHRELGNIGQILALVYLGAMARWQGDYGTARGLLEEGLALARQIGGSASALRNMGELAWAQGESEAARGFFEEGLAVAREWERRHDVAWLLAELGQVAQAQGDAVEARARLDESLAISREIGDKPATAFALQALGDLALAQGDRERARTLLAESLVLCPEANWGGWPGAVAGVRLLARVAAAEDATRAARLFGAAEALSEARGWAYWCRKFAEASAPVGENRS